MSANILTRGDHLNDIRPNGKVENWDKHKSRNLGIYELARSARELGLINVSDAWLLRFTNCAGHLNFDVNPEIKFRLKSADFCHDRLCPMCNRRRSLKLYAQMSKVTEALLKETPNIRFIFLSLTIKNVIDEQLEPALNQMSKAFRKITNSHELKSHPTKAKLLKTLLGVMRATEVTFNRNDESYHPHFHCLLAVDGNYFDSSNYLTQAEYTTIWRDALGINYTPIVDVRVIESSRGAVAEVGKYPTKLADLIVPTRDVELYRKSVRAFAVLHNALYKKHLLSFTGVFKEFRKRLKLEDLESESSDLIHIDDADEFNPIGEALFRWNIFVGGYFFDHFEPMN